jgi:SAM-dependent methyltransferase
MQDLNAERRFYDQLFSEKPENEHITSGYDELHDLAFAEPPRGPVLDLGCGTGAHAVRLARRGFDVVAVELTRPGIRAARERMRREGLGGRFLVADAEHLPFRDGAVDVAWTSLLLHHFPSLDHLPAELRRVTRSRVIAFEPNARNPLSWFAFNVVNQIWGLSSTTKNQFALWPGRLSKIFTRAGFRRQALHYIHRPWRDADSLLGVLRRTFELVTAWLPLSIRANKFLVIFEKSPG